MTEGTRIDGILAALPGDQHAALQHLRETIAAAAPDAVEAMSYGAPPPFGTTTIRWCPTPQPRRTVPST